MLDLGIPRGENTPVRELIFSTLHLLGFALTCVLWFWALKVKFKPKTGLLLACAIAIALGASTEILQSYTPDRHASWLGPDREFQRQLDRGAVDLATICSFCLTDFMPWILWQFRPAKFRGCSRADFPVRSSCARMGGYTICENMTMKRLLMTCLLLSSLIFASGIQAQTTISQYTPITKAICGSLT